MNIRSYKEKLNRLYSQLAKLQEDYESTEDYEDMAYLDKQIDKLVDEISFIEEEIERSRL